MSETFNFAVAAVRAQAAGISFRDWCRRAQRASTAAKRRKRTAARVAAEVRAKRWDLREDT